MPQSGNLQDKTVAALLQFPLSCKGNFGRSETGVFDGAGNLRRIERLIFGRVNDRGPCIQIDFDASNAFQAPQGLLGPVRSKRSGHPVDSRSSFPDLSQCRRR